MADNRYAGHGNPSHRPRARRDGDQPLRASWDPENRVGREGDRDAATDSADRARQGRTRGGAGPLRRFVDAWGWRAYAIPVLILITGAVVVDAVRSPELSSATVEDVEQQQAAAPSIFPLPGQMEGPVPQIGELPDGGPYEEEGTNEFRLVPGTHEQVGRPEAQLYRFSIEVEDGIDTAGFGGDDAVATMIESTLFNPKSWTGDGKVAFTRVDSGEPDFRVSLTTPATVRANCGYSIKVETSCYNSATGRVYLNLSRWVRGARTFEGDMGSYRQYLINHEVGHAVGHAEHEPCPKDGALAPIMMQQTISLTNSDLHRLDPQGLVPDNGDVCRPGAWPFPEA